MDSADVATPCAPAWRASAASASPGEKSGTELIAPEMSTGGTSTAAKGPTSIDASAEFTASAAPAMCCQATRRTAQAWPVLARKYRRSLDPSAVWIRPARHTHARIAAQMTAVKLCILLLLRATASRSRLSAGGGRRRRARERHREPRARRRAAGRARRGRRGDVRCARRPRRVRAPRRRVLPVPAPVRGLRDRQGPARRAVPPSSIAAECRSRTPRRPRSSRTRARGWRATTALRRRCTGSRRSSSRRSTSRRTAPRTCRRGCAATRRPPRARQRFGATTLWVELDNLYVKALSAWDGSAPACDAARGRAARRRRRPSAAAAKVAPRASSTSSPSSSGCTRRPPARCSARACARARARRRHAAQTPARRLPAARRPTSPCPTCAHARCKPCKGEARAGPRAALPQRELVVVAAGARRARRLERQARRTRALRMGRERARAQPPRTGGKRPRVPAPQPSAPQHAGRGELLHGVRARSHAASSPHHPSFKIGPVRRRRSVSLGSFPIMCATSASWSTWSRSRATIPCFSQCRCVHRLPPTCIAGVLFVKFRVHPADTTRRATVRRAMASHDRLRVDILRVPTARVGAVLRGHRTVESRARELATPSQRVGSWGLSLPPLRRVLKSPLSSPSHPAGHRHGPVSARCVRRPCALSKALAEPLRADRPAQRADREPRRLHLAKPLTRCSRAIHRHRITTTRCSIWNRRQA